MNKITNIIFIIIFLFFSKISFCKSIYSTDYHHIEMKTEDATKTKLEEIEKIKNKSFIDILDKILTTESKKYLIKEIQYKKYLNNFVQNIIIENELITNDKYIADIKINFNRSDIIYFLRENKLNYSDILSNPFLIISTYNEEFKTYGLTVNNIFYDIDKLIIESKDKLFNIKIPDLNPNDRFIISYNNISKYVHQNLSLNQQTQ